MLTQHYFVVRNMCRLEVGMFLFNIVGFFVVVVWFHYSFPTSFQSQYEFPFEWQLSFCTVFR